MRNLEIRIAQVEKSIKDIAEDKSPCYAFSFRKMDITDEEVVYSLNKKENLGLTMNAFSNWKKIKSGSSLTVLSPNFEIGKYILQEKAKREKLNGN